MVRAHYRVHVWVTRGFRWFSAPLSDDFEDVWLTELLKGTRPKYPPSKYWQFKTVAILHVHKVPAC